jgi:1-acyl-sn-glycerol-3-phosphate acyltransferase
MRAQVVLPCHGARAFARRNGERRVLARTDTKPSRRRPKLPAEDGTMTAIRTLRAGRRLTVLAASTWWAIRKLRRARRASGDCPHQAARHGNAWARRVVRALGVELVVQGAPPPGPHLLLANHRSYVDILAILSQHPCAFLAKIEVGEWPLLGTAAKLAGTVFVKRECAESRKLARESALALLERGVAFAAFPEGTTFRGPGVLPFFPGLFRLAEQYGVPVVPVAVEYADPADAWVGDEAFLPHFLTAFGKKRVRVRLVFGQPLHADRVEDLRETTFRWIRDRVR